MSLEDFSKEEVMFQLGIPPVRVDLLTSVPGLEFAGCWVRREEATIGAMHVPMVGLDDLIVSKERAGRDQDLLDLAKLRKARDR